MSLPNSKRQASRNKKLLRSKSVENRKKMSFSKQQSNQLSISTILQRTVKSTNQLILSQQNIYRESMMNQSRQAEQGQSNGQSTNSKSEPFCWQIIKIEQKRKIKGIKSKFTWCSNKQSSSITARVILTDNYVRMNEPQYFIQLDSANIDLSIDQQKSIQKQINKLIEDEQSKTEQLKNEIIFWLRSTLVSIHNLFINMKLNLRKKVKEVEFKRFTINSNYILYPCPASITWSPHGMLCLTENKVGTLSRPIVGNIYSYRNLIEAPYKFQRFSKKNNEIDDLKMVEERREEEQQTTEAQFFGWDVKEQINFSIFGKLTEDQGTEQPNLSSSVTQNQNEKSEKKIIKDHETYYIGNTHNIPPKLQKIYRRHFANPGENTQFQFLQKLKIFTVKNQIAELEDGILYLIDKIQRHNRTGVIDALTQNQFTGYHAAFNKSSKEQPTFQKLRYELITEFLQDKIKSTPQSQHFLYMKCVMIQNQFFRLALESYFENQFTKLKISDVKYEKLGTFDNFDDLSAEKALFTLLEELLKAQKRFKDSAQKIKVQYKQRPQKYDDPKYRQKKYGKMIQQNIEMKLLLKGYVKKASKNVNDGHDSLTNIKFLRSESGIQIENLCSPRANRDVNLNFMPFLVVNKIQFTPFHFNMILNPNQRRNFLETVIPILWIKDRSSEKFQYKQAKRVIIANSKIINFLEKLSHVGNLWKKVDGGRKATFLKTIIREYHKFQKKSQAPLGKIYRAYCQGCTDDFTAYNIQELLRVTRCSRCKYLEGVS